jgi:hypothetical protein
MGNGKLIIKMGIPLIADDELKFDTDEPVNLTPSGGHKDKREI